MADNFLIQHVNVNVDNLDAAIPFYRDVLGLELDDTPDQGFRSQFFRIDGTQQIHMNEMSDGRPFRGHFCLVVPDFRAVFRRAKACNAIDIAPWGKVRQLPNGKMQMFLRDPSGNLIEIANSGNEQIDLATFRDDMVEPRRGVYWMAPGASVGHHEPS
jgi:catechol 2,3-dioxygenase-like lactoylglutathione lyase family enzyme